MDNAQGDSPGQPVTCKDPGAELLHMCFWHMDSDFLLAVRVALTKIFHFPIAIRTETCTQKKSDRKRDASNHQMLVLHESTVSPRCLHIGTYLAIHPGQRTRRQSSTTSRMSKRLLA